LWVSGCADGGGTFKGEYPLDMSVTAYLRDGRPAGLRFAFSGVLLTLNLAGDDEKHGEEEAAVVPPGAVYRPKGLTLLGEDLEGGAGSTSSVSTGATARRARA
jgi:hypothetical protein